MTIRGVAATQLCRGVSITFVLAAGGWHFSAWTTDQEFPIAIEPSRRHKERSFASFDDGVQFFRAAYASTLMREYQRVSPCMR